LLQFGTDRQGRTTESCQCGYRGFVRKRPTDPEIEEAQ
jgi:DNA-directed RNA polymerase subunit RPC12/RpoP